MKRVLSQLRIFLFPSMSRHRIINLFLSAPEEKKPIVHYLKQALRRRRINVLYMPFICRAGENLDEKIEAGIRSCDVFSILMTNNLPRVCYEESALARGCGKPPVPLKEADSRIEETLFVPTNVEYIELDAHNLRESIPTIAERVTQVYLERTLHHRLKRRKWEITLLGLSLTTAILHIAFLSVIAYPFVIIDLLTGLFLLLRR